MHCLHYLKNYSLTSYRMGGLSIEWEEYNKEGVCIFAKNAQIWVANKYGEGQWSIDSMGTHKFQNYCN